jgi:type IV pilus assembly protein PilW
MTLVELLIALGLSLLLAIAVVQLFIGNKKTFMLQESTARLQENGRFALAFIGADIRGSGYAGCLSDRSQINNTLNNAGSSPLWGFTQVVQGFDADGENWDPDWTAAAYGDSDRFSSAIKGTDILTLHTVGGVAAKATQEAVAEGETEELEDKWTGTGNQPIELQSNPGFRQGDIIFITDCDKGAITQITGPDTVVLEVEHGTGVGDPGNATDALGSVYAKKADVYPEVYTVSVTSYFVAQGASGRPALWRKVDDEASQEMVQGVENLQLLYGVADENNWGTVTRYITAGEVETADAWDRVAAIRIRLLFQSDNDVLEQTQAYTFDGADVEVTDRRIRRDFTTTIGVRNRIL